MLFTRELCARRGDGVCVCVRASIAFIEQLLLLHLNHVNHRKNSLFIYVCMCICVCV